MTSINQVTPITDPTTRKDIYMLVENVDGVINADANTGMPRVDPDTYHGLIRPACIKRWIRDSIQNHHPEKGILISRTGALNDTKEKALVEIPKKDRKKDLVTDAVKKHFVDVRLHGSVLNTGDFKGGSVTGSLQFDWGRTVDPITISFHTITRVCATNASDKKETEMGTEYTVPYGLYVIKGHYSPLVGEKNGVTAHDLAVFWDALMRGPEEARSNARNPQVVGIWVFNQESQTGYYPARSLFKKIRVQKKGVEFPRSASDYEVSIPTNEDLPKGITITSIYEEEGLRSIA